MSAMFGDEVKWDEVRVFTGKQRPLSECFFRLVFVLSKFRFRSTCSHLPDHWDTCQVFRPANKRALCEHCRIQNSDQNFVS